MAVISDPEDTTADPTVWGLLYTITQTGIIEPGLYRITGPSTSDLIKLGDITISVTDNDRLLLLSCRIEDLINDAAFSAWYDPLDPVLKAGLMAQKITLTQGAQEADICEGILMYPRTLLIVPETNSLPGLSDPRVRSGTAPRIEITYSDAEQHFPVITEVGFDGDLDVVYPFFPQSLDYSGDVRYHTQAGIPELVSGAWDTARVRFSDNGTDFVEVLVTPETGVVSEQLVPTECTLEANYPNPFNAETIIPFTIDRTQMVDLSIYNVRGVLVERLLHQVLAPGQYRIPWTNRKMHSGIYFIRMQGQGEIHTVKCALIR